MKINRLIGEDILDKDLFDAIKLNLEFYRDRNEGKTLNPAPSFNYLIFNQKSGTQINYEEFIVLKEVQADLKKVLVILLSQINDIDRTGPNHYETTLYDFADTYHELGNYSVMRDLVNVSKMETIIKLKKLPTNHLATIFLKEFR